MPGTTPNYAIAYPLATENIRRQQLQDLATTADAALRQGVDDAAQAAQAAAAPYADTATTQAAAATASAAQAAAAALSNVLLLMGA